MNGQRNPELILQKKKKNEGFGVSDPGGGMDFTFFWLELGRITSNYLELLRISQNRGQVIMNNIGSHEHEHG